MPSTPTSTPPRHVILGTAGHIDHGKSALVLALTGTDPDRLKEEKRRGITIDLGFADLEVEPGKILSFVDVPGHERFVRHMVAGATGIDAVMLVVAADQGVQPQTREHLEICALLGLRRGLVALTKCDLADSDLREVVTLEIRELLEGCFLEDAPIVQVSAHTGDGLDELRGELGRLIDEVPPRPESGVPRLPVDRSFVLRGFGTVVTGTLASGKLQEGAEVEILPGGKRGRIRGLQVHHQQVERAAAGQRTAVNLQGLDCDDVPRGSTVSLPGAMTTTRRLWARLQLLPDAPEKLRDGGPARFHQGTGERAARVRVLGQDADGSLHVEIYLDREAALAPGDRFILRRPAPVDTVGGGTVMDVRPPRPKEGDPGLFDLAALEQENVLRLRLQRAGDAGSEPAELGRETGFTADQLEATAESLLASDSLVRAAARWFDGDAWRAMEERALRVLREFHDREPLLAGIDRETLRAKTSGQVSLEAWRQLLEGVAASGRLTLQSDKVALAGHAVVLSDAERKLMDEIDEAFLRAGLDPPEADSLIPPRDRKRGGKLLDLLVARGRLVRIHGGKLFHAEALGTLISRLREYGRGAPTINVAAFKELAGVTRKNAIPLLEHLDSTRVTRRVGNERQILQIPSDNGS